MRSRSLSILGLIVTGQALIALPLIVLGLTGAWNARQLANESNRLLAGGVTVTQRSQLLEEEVVALERAARQYQVVGEPALRHLFDEHLRKAEESIDQLEILQGYGVGDWDLAGIRRDLLALSTAASAGDAASAEWAQALTRFPPLRERAHAINLEARAFIAREAATLQQTAQRNSDKLMLLAMVMLPLAGLVALVLAIYVTFPLQRIDRAIRNLGANKLDQTVTIGGPREISLLGQQLNWLRQRLQGVEQDKNRFLRHMAHELKTPLASVREGAELLVDGVLGPLSGRQQEVANILRNNSFELQVLIENLLDYEEWREKAGKLELSQFALKPLITDCLHRYRLMLASQQIKIVGRCSDVEIVADRVRLRMTLDNLISNAIKFSPKSGSVTLQAQVESTRARGGEMKSQLTLEVADEGPGIQPAERGKIFEPFYQGAPPRGRHLEGTGIGLSVVRDCVAAHDGKIELVDGQHAGAHFKIVLPLGIRESGAAHAKLVLLISACLVISGCQSWPHVTWTDRSECVATAAAEDNSAALARENKRLRKALDEAEAKIKALTVIEQKLESPATRAPAPMRPTP